jgi:hypothetical protein
MIEISGISMIMFCCFIFILGTVFGYVVRFLMEEE